MDGEVRTATNADMAAVAEIYAYYVQHSAATFELEPPAPAEMEHRRATVTSNGMPFLVIENQGAVVGYAYARQYRPRPAYRFTVEDSIYLHRDATGKGLGRMLLGELIARCAHAGSQQMVAVIGDSANAASVRLHAGFGFRHVGVLEAVGCKFGAWYDTVLMQRAL